MASEGTDALWEEGVVVKGDGRSLIFKVYLCINSFETFSMENMRTMGQREVKPSQQHSR